MEIKCNICGTVNDGSTNFCKGCFQKLDEERKIENLEAKVEPIVEVPIEEEKEKEIPWVGEEVEEPTENNFDEIGELIVEPIKEEPLSEVEIPLEDNKTIDSNEEINWDIPETPINEVIGNNNVEVENIVEETKEPTENVDKIEESVIEPISDIESSEIEIPLKNEETTDNNEIHWDISETPVNEVIENNNVESEKNIETNEIEEPIAEISLSVSENEEANKETIDSIEDISTTNVALLDDSWNDNWDNQNELVEGIPEIVEKTDDWNEEVVEEPETSEKQPKFILKFLLFYLVSAVVLFGGLLLTSKYITGMFDAETGSLIEFVIYRIAMLIILFTATKLTFLKTVPSEDKLNKVTFSILSFVAIPGILIQLFVLGFVKDTKVLLFTIAIILAVITLEIFFSYIRNMIMKKLQVKKDDKTLFIYGISSIVIVVILLVFGMFARTKNLDMPKINFLYNIFHNEEKDTELITNFIYSVEKTILRNQTDDPNYVMPTTITDVSFATYEEKTPDSLELTINENGGVVSGTITYRDITYQYNEGSVKE